MKVGHRSVGDVIALTLFHLIRIFAIVFCIAPAILIFVYSFYEDVFVNFPPHRQGFGLYESLLTDMRWRGAIWVSLIICIPSAILTVLLVTPTAIALERSRLKRKETFEFMALIPMLMPGLAYVVGVYIIYLELGLIGNRPGLVLALAVTGSPTAFLIIRAILRRLPRNLDLVAMSLGASKLRAMFDITLRLLVPAMLVAMLFSFISAFNDAVLVVFLAGPRTTTVAKLIFDTLAHAIRPEVAALAASLMLFVMILVIFGQWMRRKAAVR